MGVVMFEARQAADATTSTYDPILSKHSLLVSECLSKRATHPESVIQGRTLQSHTSFGLCCSTSHRWTLDTLLACDCTGITDIAQASMWTEIALCLVLVALRTWLQFRNTRRFYSNDFLIIFATTCHLLATIIYQLAAPTMYKFEEQKATLTAGVVGAAERLDRETLYLRYHFCLLILLWVTLWAVKFSLLLFFWRMFDSIQTRAKAFWWVVCGLTASTFVVALFIQLFACETPANLFIVGKDAIPQNFQRRTQTDQCAGGCSTRRHVYLNNLAFLFAAGADIGLDVFSTDLALPLHALTDRSESY